MKVTKFIPYNLKTCVVKVTGYENKLLCGTVSHVSFDGERSFDNQIQLIFMLDELFDSVNYPQRATASRCFMEKGEPVKEQAETVSLTEGEPERILTTFRISVLFRQNASWQGSVLWLEENAESQFRSVLELLMIMDSAFNTDPAEIGKN